MKSAPGNMYREMKQAVMHPVQTANAMNNMSVGAKLKMSVSSSPLAGLVKAGEVIHAAATQGGGAAGQIIGDHIARTGIEVAVVLATEGAGRALGGLSTEGASLGDLFKGGAPKASALSEFAEGQGWKATQTESGPLKFLDENGVNRMTLKEGSLRAPGSESPHVELRDASGQRINPEGAPVTRKSPDNHTPIEWDLKR